jgi:hypothetical protein
LTGSSGSAVDCVGNISITGAEKDITVTSGSNGINGAAVVLTSKSGSIQVVGSNNGIAASTSVSLTAAKDIAVGGNAYGCAVYAYAVPVTVTAGGTVSSASPYGWGTGALTIKANRVAITGTNGVSLQSTGSTPGVTITNSTGGSCKSVNLTANGSNKRRNPMWRRRRDRQSRQHGHPGQNRRKRHRLRHSPKLPYPDPHRRGLCHR